MTIKELSRKFMKKLKVPLKLTVEDLKRYRNWIETLESNKVYLDVIHEDMEKDQNRRKRSKVVKKRKGTK